jgi:hypothetical protein
MPLGKAKKICGIRIEGKNHFLVYADNTNLIKWMHEYQTANSLSVLKGKVV